MSNYSLTLPPGLPLTYPDIRCLDDVDPLARETKSDLENLIQDVQHILEENLGSNLDDPLRGVGISNYLSGTVDNLNGIPGIVKDQLTRDPRIDTASCTISQGTTPQFPWIVAVEIGVNGTVVPLQFGWSLTGALTPLAGGGI